MSSLSSLITDPSSALSYRLCEPAPAHPSALLILLHGVGGNETNLAEMVATAPADALVVLARGRLTLGPGQYAWFRVAFTTAGPQIVASEAEESRLALIHLVKHLQGLYGIEPMRTVMAGFSQGGILSASVGLSAPESVKGFVVLAGRILPELEPVLAPRERLTSLRALIAHGQADDKLPVSWAERAHAWLDQLGVSHALKLYPGGHGLSSAMVSDFKAWLQGVLPPPSSANMMTLHLEADAVRLSGGSLGSPGLRIAPGISEIVRAHLAQQGSLALTMEAAIAAIEDELALVPKALHRSRVASSSASLRTIARAAGLNDSASVLSREAVEQVFARQSAVALGRPATSDWLPPDLSFVAELLLARELMHHLDIDSIKLMH
ncbi:MAG: hypothetical protein KGL90_05910 [Burkholderiales bacterium]|nr:hypothetical protein [Burkholderiales bacterium]